MLFKKLLRSDLSKVNYICLAPLSFETAGFLHEIFKQHDGKFIEASLVKKIQDNNNDKFCLYVCSHSHSFFSSVKYIFESLVSKNDINFTGRYIKI